MIEILLFFLSNFGYPNLTNSYNYWAELNIIDCNIKPANILLSARTAHSVEKVYLVDFDSGQSMTIVETYGDMPPEQFLGRKPIAASDHEALEALDKPKLTTVSSKLAGSRIIITKNNNYFQVFIPPKGFSLVLILTIGFTIIWTCAVVWYSKALATWSSGGRSMTFFGIGHLAIGIFFILRILFMIFGQTSLAIDHQQISLNYQLFGLNYYKLRSAPRQNISKIEKINASYRMKGGELEKVQPQINIWVGTKKVSLGGDGILSDLEIDWLAYELSDWLDLPLH